MNLPGYDAWKTREPDWDQRACSSCGEWMRHSFSLGWHCEFCDERDADLEAQAKRDDALANEEEIMEPSI